MQQQRNTSQMQSKNGGKKLKQSQKHKLKQNPSQAEAKLAAKVEANAEATAHAKNAKSGQLRTTTRDRH